MKKMRHRIQETCILTFRVLAFGSQARLKQCETLVFFSFEKMFIKAVKRAISFFNMVPSKIISYARSYAADHGLEGSCIIQTEGPSPDHPAANHKMELIDL